MGGDGFEAVDAAFGFGGSGLRASPDPFQFPPQEHLPAFFGDGFTGAALGAGLQITGVIAFVGIEQTVGQFDDPVGDAVQKVTVVSDEQQGTRIFFQELDHPEDGFVVQVVGWFVENQQFWPGDQSLAQGDAPLFAAGKIAYGTSLFRNSQVGHGGSDPLIQMPAVQSQDLLLDALVAGRIGGKCFELLDQAQDFPGSGTDTFLDGVFGI